MRCFTRRVGALVLAAWITGHSALWAITAAPDQPPVTLAELEEFRATGIPEEKWVAVLEVLGSEGHGRAARALLLHQEPFPAARLVEMLMQPKLAVRLGALEMLEDAAGETYGFDPWSAEPAGGANAEALARWRAWAAQGPKAPTSPARLSAEGFRTLVVDIMAQDRERAERALQRLESYGLGAISHLEALLQEQSTGEPGARAALKMAEYRLLLRSVLPREAVALSRQLALGGPDAQANSLPGVASGGAATLPIIADFLASPDPLVRETAVDAAFKAGEARAVELTFPMLAGEKAESVLHALLRNLGQRATQGERVQALSKFLEHPSENLAIAAADALGHSKVGDVSAPLAARLSDARWRVRAAALEAIGKRMLTGLAEPVEKKMDDADQFVRVTAAQTYQALLKANSYTTLLARFARQDELKSTILQGFLDEENAPLDALWESLAKAPVPVILECLDSLEDRSDHEGKRLVHAARFTTHPNADVRAAALRLLAGHGLEPGQLQKALQSPDAAQRDAVLDQLHLPPGFLHSRAAATETPAGPAHKSTLDRLYDFFSSTPAKPQTTASTGPPADPVAFRKILENFFQQGSPRQRFRAALVLAGQVDTPGAQYLLENLEVLSGLDRREIATTFSNLGEWAPGPVPALMTRLLADPADDVRETVIAAWLENATPKRLEGLLSELSRPGSLLKPDDLYGWKFDRTAKLPTAKPGILAWATATLENPNALGAHQVLAMILLDRSGQAAGKVERYLDSPNPWLRRAAYRALGLPVATAHLPALVQDDSGMVRAALPFLAAPHSQGWQHWFDDAHSVQDEADDYREPYRSSSRQPFGAWAGKGNAPAAPGSTAPNAEVLAALEKMQKDPSDVVRFEASLALLRLGKSVDPEALAALVPVQPDHSQARYRIGQLLSDRFASMNKGYGVLLAQATNINEQNRAKMFAHFGVDQGAMPMSFAALGMQGGKSQPPPPAAVAPIAAALPVAPEHGEGLRVLFFHKSGCRDCERARQMLAEQSRRYSGIVIEERDMAESQSALLNETLSARFHVPDHLHQATPAIFTQAGLLLREEITSAKVGDLLQQAAGLTPDASWRQAGSEEAKVAESKIVERYDTLSLGIVTLAGLADGINPCAMATIIFLLSYMQVARRAPGEILAVGAAFVTAVFATYFVLGLGLAEVLGRLSALRVVGTMLNYALAAFALLLALLSFRDAALAAQGKAGEMALQLPESLKGRIRGIIRTGSRAPRYILAALVAGVLISLLELACTGQVYLPTIQYMLRQGRTSAVWPLLWYNVAFILPLILVFALAWAGLRSEALVVFQRRHTALVKVGTGILFLGLMVLLLFTFRTA